MVKNSHFRIICMKADSGLPLFVRSIGVSDQLQDPVVTSLNGIYTFCSSFGVKLTKTIAGDVCISWKTFYKSLTLIMVTNASLDEDFHENLLNLIFNSFILLLGFGKLQQNVNFDLLKRDLQVCYRLVDSLVAEDFQYLLPCVLTQTVSCLSSPNLLALQKEFEKYAKSLEASLGCVFISGLMSAATADAKKMTAVESVLLQRFVLSTLSSSSSNVFETVVHLPETSPNEEKMLVLLRITDRVAICLLFGRTPNLHEIILRTQQFWSPGGDGRTGVGLSPWSLADDLSKMPNASLPLMKDINKDVVSFLVVNRSLNKSLLCTDVNELHKTTRMENGRILKAFYAASQKFFRKTTSIKNTGQDISIPYETDENQVALSYYALLGAFKCHASRRQGREFYVVFGGEMPLFAARFESIVFLLL